MVGYNINNNVPLYYLLTKEDNEAILDEISPINMSVCTYIYRMVWLRDVWAGGDDSVAKKLKHGTIYKARFRHVYLIESCKWQRENVPLSCLPFLNLTIFFVEFLKYRYAPDLVLIRSCSSAERLIPSYLPSYHEYKEVLEVLLWQGATASTHRVINGAIYLHSYYIVKNITSVFWWDILLPFLTDPVLGNHSCDVPCGGDGHTVNDEKHAGWIESSRVESSETTTNLEPTSTSPAPACCFLDHCPTWRCAEMMEGSRKSRSDEEHDRRNDTPGRTGPGSSLHLGCIWDAIFERVVAVTTDLLMWSCRSAGGKFKVGEGVNWDLITSVGGRDSCIGSCGRSCTTTGRPTTTG